MGDRSLFDLSGGRRASAVLAGYDRPASASAQSGEDVRLDPESS